jgi:hypothetical protein
MKAVFDAPMAAGDMQQPFGRHVFGQQIMAHEAARLVLRMMVARRASRRS